MRLSLGITPKSYFSLAAATDTDAQAFITAAGITDATQKSAVNQLVLDLKGYSIWTKMKAIYPIVGGSATTHKWNLKDPRDLDAAFRLTFATGMTHSSTGMTPNGTSAYANTFLAPNSFYSTNIHLSYYSRTSTIGIQCEIGASTVASGTNYSTLRIGVNSVFGQTTNGLVNFNSITDARGLFLSQKVSNSSRKVFKNGILNNSTTTTDSNPLPTFNLVLAAINDNGTVGTYSTKECSFASIGDGLTDTETANLYTAVQNYQTTLGRNV